MADELVELGSNLVTVEEETISFEGPGLELFSFGTNWKPLFGINGEIKTRVVNDVLVVSYYLNFRRLIMFPTVTLALAALFVVISTRDPFPVGPITLGWFFLVGGNYWFDAKITFPRLIRRVLKDINE